jgi:hypothetical protein
MAASRSAAVPFGTGLSSSSGDQAGGSSPTSGGDQAGGSGKTGGSTKANSRHRRAGRTRLTATNVVQDDANQRQATIDENADRRAVALLMLDSLDFLIRGQHKGISTELPHGRDYWDARGAVLRTRVGRKLSQDAAPRQSRRDQQLRQQELEYLRARHKWVLDEKNWNRTTATVRCGANMPRECRNGPPAELRARAQRILEERRPLCL